MNKVSTVYKTVKNKKVKHRKIETWKKANVLKHKCLQCRQTGIEITPNQVHKFKELKPLLGLNVLFEDGSIWRRNTNWCNVQEKQSVYIAKEDFSLPSNSYSYIDVPRTEKPAPKLSEKQVFEQIGRSGNVIDREIVFEEIKKEKVS